MLPLVGCYEYNYHPGSGPDRKILFYEKEPNHIIEAHIQAKSDGQWKDIGTLSENDILLEGEKLSLSVKRYAESIDLGNQMEVIPDKKFTQLSLEEKKWVITQLRPNGAYDLTVRHRYGEDPRFEIVYKIGFFDPT